MIHIYQVIHLNICRLHIFDIKLPVMRYPCLVYFTCPLLCAAKIVLMCRTSL